MKTIFMFGDEKLAETDVASISVDGWAVYGDYRPLLQHLESVIITLDYKPTNIKVFRDFWQQLYPIEPARVEFDWDFRTGYFSLISDEWETREMAVPKRLLGRKVHIVATEVL